MGKAHKRVRCFLMLLTVLLFFDALHPHPPLKKLITFLDIQKILTLSRDIASELEAQAAYNNDYLALNPTNPSYFRPQFDQTQQGLYLFTSLYPRCLASPWGQIPIYEKPQTSVLKYFAMATTLLLKKIEVEKIGTIPTTLVNPCPSATEDAILHHDQWYLIVENTNGKLCTQPTTPPNASCRRLCDFDATTHGLYCFPITKYEILATQENISPKPIDLSAENFRSRDDVVTEWTELEQWQIRQKEERQKRLEEDIEQIRQKRLASSSSSEKSLGTSTLASALASLKFSQEDR